MTSDETKLRQCIVNFLSNAFKFTENGQVALVSDQKEIEGKEYINFDIELFFNQFPYQRRRDTHYG